MKLVMLIYTFFGIACIQPRTPRISAEKAQLTLNLQLKIIPIAKSQQKLQKESNFQELKILKLLRITYVVNKFILKCKIKIFLKMRYLSKKGGRFKREPHTSKSEKKV